MVESCRTRVGNERRRQLVYASIRTTPGDIAKMLVVRQIEYLTHFRYVGE